MKAASRWLVVLVVCTTACRPAPRDGHDELRQQTAVDLVVRAFEKYPLVALSEGAGHGQPDTRAFFAALILDERFSRRVRNIVVEFGNARYQSVMDRYVSGQPVSPEELRHVWEDTTQVTGVWSLPMYEGMFADVRALNATLPSARRIRVLLGDPPIDWSAVTSPADEDMNDWRDAHFAHVVEREVRNRNETALLLIGGAHIGRKVVFPNSLIHLLDSRLPGQTWVIAVLDIGRADAAVAARLRRWRVPAGAPVRDTWFGRLDVKRIGFDLSEGVAEDDMDAILLLNSSPPRLEQSRPMDARYGRELARRQALGFATLPFRGARIRFEENRAEFAAASYEPLQAVLAELVRDRGLRLLVKAFADPAETDPVRVSTRRAEKLADWLAERGVNRDRLVPKGCGARRPLNFGNTAANRAMNRRAELVRLTPTAGCDPPW